MQNILHKRFQKRGDLEKMFVIRAVRIRSRFSTEAALGAVRVCPYYTSFGVRNIKQYIKIDIGRVPY